jgi:hypothetical protein
MKKVKVISKKYDGSLRNLTNTPVFFLPSAASPALIRG